MIRRYLSAALAALVILVALVALVAQAVLERRTYDLDRSARVIDEALADPANRDALDRSLTVAGDREDGQERTEGGDPE